MSVADLEAELAGRRIADDPDAWAVAAFRLAVAKSEVATRPTDLDDALALFDRAGRILTAERAPLEHSRILTAAASCHRAAGRPDRALPLFERAAELAEPRAADAERAAALVNLGLTYVEAGHAEQAVAALDAAIELLGSPADDEAARLLGAALVNRAQAQHAGGDEDALAAAVADYRDALSVLPPESPQAGMAAHGLGAALLERNRRDPAQETVDMALASFERSLAIFGATAYPFQHAVARHSLSVAYERRRQPGDLARALNSVEASLSLFDPRLHQQQWRAAAEALARLERTLDQEGGTRSRTGHIVELMATTDPDERAAMLRERLQRVATQPAPRLEAEVESLAMVMAERSLDDYDRLTRSLIGVLMELPEHVLEAACAAVCRAHLASDDTEARDRALDTVIHDTLFGPQRVRVRDLLSANGWVRP